MTILDSHNLEQHPKPDDNYHTNIKDTLRKIDSGPSSHNEPETKPGRRPGHKQVPVDLIEEESMESFPASDPPGHIRSHTAGEKPEPRRPSDDDV